MILAVSYDLNGPERNRVMIFVTGATGNVGSELTARYVRATERSKVKRTEPVPTFEHQL
jgi:hypothetical protein